MMTPEPRLGGTAAALLVNLPIGMQDICATASDPLEIAAALEARGISSRVASDRFGELDVFGLAETLFLAVRPATLQLPDRRTRQRRGGPRELLRGAMFAAPGVMFAAVLGALNLHVPSWTYLVALTVGWAFGQSVAAVGSTLASRNIEIGSLAAWWLIGAGAVTAGLAALGAFYRHGGMTPVVVAAVVTLYMVSCSTLLLQGRFRAMALPLLPATAFALIYLLHRPLQLSRAVTVGVIGVAIALTIGAALRHVPLRMWRIPTLVRGDLGVGARYFGHGLLCGLATSLIIVLSSESTSHSSVIPVAGYPVLISLGMMEWQLYSFRSRAQTALRSTTSTGQFARRVGRAFWLSFSIYVLSLMTACCAVGGYLVWHHASVPFTLLAAEACLGCTFFVGLVASTCDRMVLVLISGTFGLVLYGAIFAARRLATGSFDQGFARASCCCAVAVALALLLVFSRRSVRSAFSYQ